MQTPKGTFGGEFQESRGTRYRASGEFRAPKRGEHYLSGAIVAAYWAPNDFSPDSRYWIAVPVKMATCSHCNGTGRVEAIPDTVNAQDAIVILQHAINHIDGTPVEGNAFGILGQAIADITCEAWRNNETIDPLLGA